MKETVQQSLTDALTKRKDQQKKADSQSDGSSNSKFYADKIELFETKFKEREQVIETLKSEISQLQKKEKQKDEEIFKTKENE